MYRSDFTVRMIYHEERAPHKQSLAPRLRGDDGLCLNYAHFDLGFSHTVGRVCETVDIGR